MPFFFLPLLPLALVSLLLQNWIGLGYLVILLLLFLIEYGTCLLPKHRTISAQAGLRVMTWNTLYLNKNVEAALAMIEQLQPDIIALQELGVDFAAGLAAALVNYPHRALFPRNSPKGYGIFSRFPITEAIAPKIAEGEYWSHQVQICVDGQAFTLINAHPRIPDIHLRYFMGIPVPIGFDTEPQDVQLRCILQQIERVQGPLLVVGDFNLSDRQPMYREFSRRLNDTQRNVGWGLGFTFPTDLSILSYFKVPIPAYPMLPFLRLDYLFYNNAWRAIRVTSGTIPGSDHRFLIADLEMKKVLTQ